MTTKTKTKTKTAKPTMTLEEIRAELAGEEKEVFITLSKATTETPIFLKGKTPTEIAQFLYETARKADFPDDFVLDRRSIPVTKERQKYQRRSYGGWGYVTKVTTEKEGPYWVLMAYTPYTDEELLAKGEKLVEQRRRRDKAAAKKIQKKVDDFNLRARELGQSTITVEDLA